MPGSTNARRRSGDARWLLGHDHSDQFFGQKFGQNGRFWWRSRMVSRCRGFGHFGQNGLKTESKWAIFGSWLADSNVVR